MNLYELIGEELFELAILIWKSMTEGSNGVDYGKFSEYFSQEMKDLVTSERFENRAGNSHY